MKTCSANAKSLGKDLASGLKLQGEDVVEDCEGSLAFEFFDVCMNGF